MIKVENKARTNVKLKKEEEDWPSERFLHAVSEEAHREWAAKQLKCALEDQPRKKKILDMVQALKDQETNMMVEQQNALDCIPDDQQGMLDDKDKGDGIGVKISELPKRKKKEKSRKKMVAVENPPLENQEDAVFLHDEMEHQKETAPIPYDIPDDKDKKKGISAKFSKIVKRKKEEKSKNTSQQNQKEDVAIACDHELPEDIDEDQGTQKAGNESGGVLADAAVLQINKKGFVNSTKSNIEIKITLDYNRSIQRVIGCIRTIQGLTKSMKNNPPDLICFHVKLLPHSKRKLKARTQWKSVNSRVFALDFMLGPLKEELDPSGTICMSLYGKLIKGIKETCYGECMLQNSRLLESETLQMTQKIYFSLRMSIL